jgi:predicted TIM-barrel fold metal-dependent hydrolase
MPFDALTYAWNHPERLGPALAGRFAADASGPWARLDGSFDQLADAVRPMTAAIVCGLRADAMGLHVDAREVAEAVSRDAMRLGGFVGIDPMNAAWRDDLEQALAMGMRGVCVAPAAQGVHPTHPHAMELWDLCQRRSLPVISAPLGTKVGAGPIEFARPLAWDEPARAFPRLRILVGGLGWPWVDECLAMLSRHPNLFAEVSTLVPTPWRLYGALRDAWALGVLDRVLLGSAFPFAEPQAAAETTLRVNAYAPMQGPRIPTGELRRLVERDCFAALGARGPRLSSGVGVAA